MLMTTAPAQDHSTAGKLPPLKVTLTRKTALARGIVMLELTQVNGIPLPPAAPGAHVDIILPHHGPRQYSLVTDGADSAYHVAIKREESGKGGSRYLVDDASIGETFEISLPRSNFSLVESSQTSVLIAGGIGITPIYSMSQRLRSLGAPWQLHAAFRLREDALFESDLGHLDHVRYHFSGESDSTPLDIGRVVAESPPDAHIYCCGPQKMMQAFELAVAHRPAHFVHIEYFSASQAAALGGFSVRLNRSGQILPIPPGSSILDALIAADIDVPYSCKDGVCGACQVDVVHGIPDHRDSVMTEDEKATNDSIMVCCSGSHSEILTLDL